MEMLKREARVCLLRFTFLLIGAVIFGCAAGGTTDQDLRKMDPEVVLEKTWQWHSTITPVEKIMVSAPDRYTIRLTKEGRLQAQFDCNKGGGSFEISKGRVSFGPLFSTRMACPQDTLDHRFASDLQRVTSFFIQDGSLYLELPYDSGTMKFRQAP